MNKKISIQNKSIWLDLSQTKRYPELTEGIKTDVAILGAGIAGINCAYLLTQIGYTVALIDARKISHGVTGHTTAKITSQHNLIYKYIIDNFGFEKAEKYAKANEDAIKKYREIVEEEEIDCDLFKRDAFVYADQEGDVGRINDEIDATKRLGIKSDFVENLDFPFEAYGAIRFKNQAQFNPIKYMQELLEKIENYNEENKIFENTIALNVKEGSPCTITTNKGSLKANHIIISTHYPLLDQESKYYTKMYQKRSHILVAKIADKFPEGMYISSNKNFKSFRDYSINNEKVLLIGGERYRPGEDTSIVEKTKRLEDYAKKTFNVKSLDYIWSTQDNVTLDRIPYIGKLNENSEKMYVATGFGGWGMTTGMVAATILRDEIEGIVNPWSDVFNPHRGLNFKAHRKFISQGINVAKVFTKSKIPLKKTDEIKIKKNTGAVINFKGKKTGVYKDSKGKIFALENKCTHMGCSLSWNDSEKSWDCPCHASRFNHDGEVIHGPATKNLRKVNLKK
jgi:glycine/D-amino acid oxidase-like deaminating enzyme/nitrite reductase/ring-hydroxylating ferredoxin subunit